jgi:HEAT repeat protein
MTWSTVLVWAMLALAAALLSLTIVVGVHKARRELGEKRRAALIAELRPRLLVVLDGDAPDAGLSALGRGGGRAVDDLASDLLPKLRGDDRAALVGLLESRGTLQRARRRLRSRSPVRRAGAAELLGRAGDTRATEDMLRLLSDRDVDVRSATARALGKMGDPAAVPALLAALDADRPVPATVVTMALLHLGPGATEALTEALDSGSPRARAIVADLLGLDGAFGALTALERSLADPTAAVRAASARALGRLGAPSAVKPLAASLRHDENLEVRISAAWALGETGGTQAVEALRQALVSEQPLLVRGAAIGLGSCGSDGKRVLEAGARQTQCHWSADAREALGVLAARDFSRVTRPRVRR